MLTGTVSGLTCDPIKRARVDFWQADAKGVSDKTGNRLRGHQFTDGNGSYHLETIVPGADGKRAPHLNVRVQPPGKAPFSSTVSSATEHSSGSPVSSGAGAQGDRLARRQDCDLQYRSRSLTPFRRQVLRRLPDRRTVPGEHRASLSGLSCGPIKRARVDFWQADARGVYDKTGDRLRGHQFTDGNGNYHLETIVRARMGSARRDLNVRVQPPGKAPFSTQLLFPDQPENKSDPQYRPELMLKVTDARGGKTATFNIVLDL